MLLWIHFFASEQKWLFMLDSVDCWMNSKARTYCAQQYTHTHTQSTINFCRAMMGRTGCYVLLDAFIAFDLELTWIIMSSALISLQSKCSLLPSSADMPSTTWQYMLYIFPTIALSPGYDLGRGKESLVLNKLHAHTHWIQHLLSVPSLPPRYWSWSDTWDSFLSNWMLILCAEIPYREEFRVHFLGIV